MLASIPPPAKFNRGEPLTAEEALGISLKCNVCQRATNKTHLPGCDYSARNEVAWDLKRDRRAVAKAAKKATIKKEALLGTYNRRRCDYSLLAGLRGTCPWVRCSNGGPCDM